MTDIDNTNEIISKSVGRVKWFNNKTGYGFLTVVSTDSEGDIKDVFVHHSAINVKGDQYKYLVQGEYVNFTVNVVEGGDHKYQAENVTGIGGGQTMCETRNENRKEREDTRGEGNGDGHRDGGVRPVRNSRDRNYTSNRRHNQSGGNSEVSGLVRRELWNLLNEDKGISQGRPSNRRIDNTSE